MNVLINDCILKFIYCISIKLTMDRLNVRTSMAYWKITISLLAFISITSALSSKCHESNTLSRHHIIKYSEMIRSAMQHSIASSQHTNVVSSYRDSCIAKCSVDLVASILTPKQIRSISNVDILEMQDFISCLLYTSPSPRD